MVNASLTYEILLYLNSFYFGIYAVSELTMGILKAVNLPYPESVLPREALLLLGLCIIETIRISFGRNGSLSDHGWQVISSVFMTIPCAMGVMYFLIYQQHILRLEYILCALMLALQLTEIVYAIVFVFTMCRPPTYT